MTSITDSAADGASNSGRTLTVTEHFLFSLDAAALLGTDIGVANLEPLGVTAILTGVPSALFSLFLLLKNFFGVVFVVVEELMGM